MSAVSRPNGANGDGDGENDRKERFHSTKVFVAARSCASTDCRRDVRQQSRLFARWYPRLIQPQLQPALLRLSAMISQCFTRRRRQFFLEDGAHSLAVNH